MEQDKMRRFFWDTVYILLFTVVTTNKDAQKLCRPKNVKQLPVHLRQINIDFEQFKN